MSWGEEQQKEIETIRERKITVYTTSTMMIEQAMSVCLVTIVLMNI